MAEKLNKISTLNIPDEVIDSAWKDDIDVDYATSSSQPGAANFEIYGDNEKTEGEYISPRSVSKESIKQIKAFQTNLAFSGLTRFRKKMQKLAA